MMVSVTCEPAARTSCNTSRQKPRCQPGNASIRESTHRPVVSVIASAPCQHRQGPAGPAVAAFSIAHHITGSAAWTAALVMMALADVTARLVTVYLRGRSLAARRPRSSRYLSWPAPVPDRASRAAQPWPYR